MYEVLQLGASVLGIVVLATAFVVWYKRATPEPVPLSPQFSPGIKSAILSTMLAIAMALGFVKGLQWYGGLLRGASQHVRFMIGFALTTATVGAVELFGFSIIWRMLLARDMASAHIDSTGRG